MEPGAESRVSFSTRRRPSTTSALRERHFHVVEVPRLRILGMAILTLLVVFHEVFSTGDTNWRLPLRIGVVLLAYALASWAVLYLLLRRRRSRGSISARCFSRSTSRRSSG